MKGSVEGRWRLICQVKEFGLQFGGNTDPLKSFRIGEGQGI